MGIRTQVSYRGIPALSAPLAPARSSPPRPRSPTRGPVRARPASRRGGRDAPHLGLLEG